MFMRRVVTLLAAFVIAVSAAAIWSAQGDGRDGDPDTNVVNTSGAQAGATKKKGGGFFKIFKAPIKAVEHLFGRDDPKLARKQDRMTGIWKRVCFGCHPNRETLPRIEAAFEVEEVERGETPMGPKIVRPYVLGRARVA